MRTLTNTFVLAVFLAAQLSLTHAASPDFWIDVRSEQEYSAAHVDGAVHIPYEKIRERIGELTTDRDAEIYLYCGSGRRAAIAMNHLQSIGYSRVRNIGGLNEALEFREKYTGP
jgi:phage shock protein E